MINILWRKGLATFTQLVKVRRGKFFLYWLQLDHNDPSKPLHRLTNDPEPLKTIESDGSNIKKPS